MPLDPQIQNLLALLESAGHGSLAEGTPADARAGFRQLTVDVRQPEAVIPVKETDELTLPGPAGDLPARLYRPEGDGPTPTVVFFHGGGFVIGDLDTHDNTCRMICRDVGAVVLSVDYRLAPEHPWPAAVEDTYAATVWAGEHLDLLGGDPAKLVVGGDSAGGNLSAVVAQLARDNGGPPLAAQFLLYPATDFAGDYPSRHENAEGYFLTDADMRWFAENYLPDPDAVDDPRISPLLNPDLHGLPPAVVATAEFDPLRDEGEAYAAALAAAGGRTISTRFDGLIHGFFDMWPFAPAAAAAATACTNALRTLLAE